MRVDLLEVNENTALRVHVNLTPRKAVVDQSRAADRRIADYMSHFDGRFGCSTPSPVMNEPAAKAEIEIRFVHDGHPRDRWQCKAHHSTRVQTRRRMRARALDVRSESAFFGRSSTEYSSPPISIRSQTPMMAFGATARSRRRIASPLSCTLSVATRNTRCSTK